MSKEYASADETYKYIIKKLNVRFHRRLGYDASEIKFINVELVPPVADNKFMDIAYNVDGKYNQNLEHQSTPVYGSKMNDMFKYIIYYQSEDDSDFRTCVFATYNPNLGLTESEIKWNIKFRPDFYFTKKQKANKIINIVKNKNKNNKPLTDDEAIDLIIAPDMDHNFEYKELLKITSKLLVEATITDKQFHCDLMDCQKKMLQRLLKKDERKEIENMLNLKAEDYGLEPNVTGFEEAVNLSYLDGKREGFDNARFEYARNLIELGADDDMLMECFDLDLQTLEKLKK